MFYQSTSVDELLKCVFCGWKFINNVKLIPCGNSICGPCYDQKRAESPGELKCSCSICRGAVHTIPAHGLPDNLVLMRMLQLQPVARALPENAKQLKALISETDDQIDKLTQLSEQKELSAHCDRLVEQVNKSTQEKMAHLRQLRDSQLNQIRVYRNNLMARFSTDTARPSKRLKLSETIESIGPALDNSMVATTEQELAELIAFIQQFKRTWDEYFNLTRLADDRELEQAQAEIKDYCVRLKELEAKSKKKMLGDQPMQWKDNDRFVKQEDHLGELFFESNQQDDSSAAAAAEPMQSASESVTLQHRQTLVGHSDAVFHAVFLPNGKIASSSMDKTVKIWEPEDGQLVVDLNDADSFPICLAAISKSVIATGHGNGMIKVWDVDKQEVINILNDHKKGVFMVRVLKDGRLVSISWDNTIKIWNRHLDRLLITMSGHNCLKDAIGLGILSNGNLVTSSSFKYSKYASNIRIWNPMNGERVHSFSSTVKGATSLLVLSGDRIAIGLLDGRVALFDMAGSHLKTLRHCQKGEVLFMIQLPTNGYLITCGCQKDTAIRIWDLDSGGLVSSIDTGHTDDIWSLNLSPDGQHIASSSGDRTIRLWKLV